MANASSKHLEQLRILEDSLPLETIKAERQPFPSAGVFSLCILTLCIYTRRRGSLEGFCRAFTKLFKYHARSPRHPEKIFRGTKKEQKNVAPDDLPDREGRRRACRGGWKGGGEGGGGRREIGEGTRVKEAGEMPATPVFEGAVF